MKKSIHNEIWTAVNFQVETFKSKKKAVPIQSESN